MSHTSIFAAKSNGDVVRIADISNSWRGAMFIWSELARRYGVYDHLPPDMRGMSLLLDAKRVWALQNDKRLSDAEHYTLMTTFDGAMLKQELSGVVAGALREFVSGEAGAGLREQADVIVKAFDEGARAVSWQQTSVAECHWEVADESGENARHYNIDTDRNHWFIERRSA